MDDEFILYDLKVTVIGAEKTFVCHHHTGDYFLVQGENLVFPQTNSLSLYSLAALLPLLPAKQRALAANDWLRTDELVACPDPNCGAQFKITRVGHRRQSHRQCTAVPLPKKRGGNNYE